MAYRKALALALDFYGDRKTKTNKWHSLLYSKEGNVLKVEMIETDQPRWSFPGITRRTNVNQTWKKRLSILFQLLLKCSAIFTSMSECVCVCVCVSVCVSACVCVCVCVRVCCCCCQCVCESYVNKQRDNGKWQKLTSSLGQSSYRLSVSFSIHRITESCFIKISTAFCILELLLVIKR